MNLTEVTNLIVEGGWLVVLLLILYGAHKEWWVIGRAVKQEREMHIKKCQLIEATLERQIDIHTTEKEELKKRIAEKNAEVQFWRQATLRAIDVGEKVVGSVESTEE